jgi:hypothetical protein
MKTISLCMLFTAAFFLISCGEGSGYHDACQTGFASMLGCGDSSIDDVSGGGQGGPGNGSPTNAPTTLGTTTPSYTTGGSSDSSGDLNNVITESCIASLWECFNPLNEEMSVTNTESNFIPDQNIDETISYFSNGSKMVRTIHTSQQGQMPQNFKAYGPNGQLCFTMTFYSNDYQQGNLVLSLVGPEGEHFQISVDESGNATITCPDGSTEYLDSSMFESVVIPLKDMDQ